MTDLEAEEYRGITVEFVHGRNAVLSTYRNGTFQESTALHTLPTKEDLHSLLQEKGFVKMTDKEIEAMKKRRRKEQQDESKARHDAKVKRKKRREELARQQREREEREQKMKQAANAKTERLNRLDLIQKLQGQANTVNQARDNLKYLDEDEFKFAQRMLGIEDLQPKKQVKAPKPPDATVAGFKVPTLPFGHDEL